MKKRQICGLTIFLLLTIHSYVFCKDDLATSLLQADQLYKSFLLTEEKAHIEAAKKILDNLLLTYPDNAEVFWKAARCYNEYAIFTSNPTATYETGITFAKKSIALQDNAEAHFWLAVLYGQIGRRSGILNSLSLVKPIREEIDNCLSLDPTYDYAYHFLARFYQEVPGKPISIGDKKKALEYELKAVQLVPNHFPYQWGLYNIYRKLGLKQQAIQVLQTILQLPLEYEFDQVYHEDLTAREIKELAVKELNK